MFLLVLLVSSNEEKYKLAFDIICFNTIGSSEDIKVLVKKPLITGLYP